MKSERERLNETLWKDIEYHEKLMEKIFEQNVNIPTEKEIKAKTDLIRITKYLSNKIDLDWISEIQKKRANEPFAEEEEEELYELFNRVKKMNKRRDNLKKVLKKYN